MTPKLSLDDLMRCKQHEHEKITYFILQYQSIYTQIDVKVPNPNLQKMFIKKLRTKFQNKLTTMKFLTFSNLFNTLCDYQKLVSSLEIKKTSSQHEKSEVENQNNYQTFRRKNKGFLWIKPPQKITQPINNYVNFVKVVIPFSYGDLKRKFAPLPNTLHDTMMELVEQNMINLPLIMPLYPNNPLHPNHKPNDYYHFHQEKGHDTNNYKCLKHFVQELINLHLFSLRGVNDQGNKLVASPNKNL
jgi:hypothetical protein